MLVTINNAVNACDMQSTFLDATMKFLLLWGCRPGIRQPIAN
jgi:hypothetical protein